MFCKECHPYSYFCTNCDENIHTWESKQSHKRIPLSSLLPEENTPNILLNNNYSFHQQPQTNSSINYINDIKTIYEKEKNDILNSKFSVEKELESTRSGWTARVNELRLQIEEWTIKSENEIKQRTESFEYQLSTITNDKDNQIKLLMDRNTELTHFNEELIGKINMYIDIINNNQIEFSTTNNYHWSQIDSLNKDKNDLVKYYENKWKYFNTDYSDDKSTIINNYEEFIEKLKKEYWENKQKLLGMIEQREKDISSMIEEHRKENEEMKKDLDDINKKNLVQDKEYQDWVTKLHEQKYDIEVLKGEWDKEKKKNAELMNRNKKLDSEYNEWNAEHEYLKIEIEKLKRITHGKFSKK